jgi:hypothetical protein
MPAVAAMTVSMLRRVPAGVEQASANSAVRLWSEFGQKRTFDEPTSIGDNPDGPPRSIDLHGILAHATSSGTLRVATHRYIEDEHIELAIGAVARIRSAWHLSGRHQTGGLAGNVSAGLPRPAKTVRIMRQPNAAPRHGRKRRPTSSIPMR